MASYQINHKSQLMEHRKNSSPASLSLRSRGGGQMLTFGLLNRQGVGGPADAYFWLTFDRQGGGGVQNLQIGNYVICECSLTLTTLFRFHKIPANPCHGAETTKIQNFVFNLTIGSIVIKYEISRDSIRLSFAQSPSEGIFRRTSLGN